MSKSPHTMMPYSVHILISKPANNIVRLWVRIATWINYIFKFHLNKLFVVLKLKTAYESRSYESHKSKLLTQFLDEHIQHALCKQWVPFSHAISLTFAVFPITLVLFNSNTVKYPTSRINLENKCLLLLKYIANVCMQFVFFGELKNNYH